MQTGNDLFYSRLPVNEISLSDLLTEEHLFYSMPPDWIIVITDVKNSTTAIQNGFHETINLVATASIVAVLNIVFRSNISIPFFFGGDGATFIIPPSFLEEVIQALGQHRENTKTGFNLDLRVGHLSVDEIYREGHHLRISKLRTAEQFVIPVLLGDGLTFAEKKIKDPDFLFSVQPIAEDILDLSGMQCRWDRIKPPQNALEVISLLVVARQTVPQSRAFKKVVDALDEIYGSQPKRSPISVQKLRLKTTLAKLGLEVRTRVGQMKRLNLVKTWMKSVLAYFYFKTKKGKVYLHKLVSMSDTLIIDGRINTVICGTAEQRRLLETALNKLEAEKEILYGFFVSQESVISCYVRNLNEGHIHFVDGAEGGYTRAAGVLKKKILHEG